MYEDSAVNKYILRCFIYLVVLFGGFFFLFMILADLVESMVVWRVDIYKKNLKKSTIVPRKQLKLDFPELDNSREILKIENPKSNNYTDGNWLHSLFDPKLSEKKIYFANFILSMTITLVNVIALLFFSRNSENEAAISIINVACCFFFYSRGTA